MVPNGTHGQSGYSLIEFIPNYANIPKIILGFKPKPKIILGKRFFFKFELGLNIQTSALFNLGFLTEPMDKLGRFVQIGIPSIRIYPECSWILFATQHYTSSNFFSRNDGIVIFILGLSSVNSATTMRYIIWIIKNVKTWLLKAFFK